MEENIGKIRVTYIRKEEEFSGVEFIETEVIKPWKDQHITIERIYDVLTTSTRKYHDKNVKIKRIEILEPTPHG